MKCNMGCCGSGGGPARAPRSVSYTPSGSTGMSVTARETISSSGNSVGIHETTYTTNRSDGTNPNMRFSRDIDHSGKVSGGHITDQDLPKGSRSVSASGGSWSANAYSSLFNFWAK